VDEIIEHEYVEEKLYRFKLHWLEIRTEGFKVLTALPWRIQGCDAVSVGEWSLMFGSVAPPAACLRSCC
jgi:hypothetical protein